jgi:hypothetical protein
MANTLLYNLAAMTVASTGTGTITLGSAATINGVLFLSFASAGVANGDIVAYSILDSAGASEVGFGTYTSAGTTLTRNPTTSTNANAAINMSAAAIVRISPRLQDIGTPGQRPGTNTNDNASAGNVGEIISSSIASGSAVALTSNVAVNVTSITLTPGDWQTFIWGTFFGGATTSQSSLIVCMSTVSATLDTVTPFASNTISTVAQVVGGASNNCSVGPFRVQVASGTTQIFFVARATFTISTFNVFGAIEGIRISR